ncbi:hypothetical protein BT63DRAFT_210032 [Microthyrium microscopicum]|uniref:Mid2 domain-containing protein n=1 Tax=Microthyrium microscopicum TaxID=703497 RepID=A0A6A6UIA8_9PEZI|nr:hypothetical protein BT63DRAFT_210032 [Microthyrium microscopicum]
MKPLLLTAVAGLAGATLTLEPIKRAIFPRDLSSWGGFPILQDSGNCVSGTTTCGTASCCPNGWTCNTSGSQQASTSAPICCPSSGDCTATVLALHTCADTSWDLYSFGGYFCCASDTVGTYSSAGKQCLAKSLPIPTSISLTKVTQATSTPTGAATSGGSKVTSASAGTTTAVGGNTSSSSGSNSGSGSGSSGTVTKVPQTAAIAIAVLAGVVVLLVIFIIWRCRRSRKNAQAHIPQAQPQFQQYPGGSPMNAPVSPVSYPVHPSPPMYKAPTPMAHELTGQGVTGPVYEANAVHRVELDAR